MSRIIVLEQSKIKCLREADGLATIYCSIYTRHSWYIRYKLRESDPAVYI